VAKKVDKSAITEYVDMKTKELQDLIDKVQLDQYYKDQELQKYIYAISY